MADEPTTPAAAPSAPAPATPPPAEDKTVPYDRFAQVNDQAKEAKRLLEETQARLQELEDKDKSELERERSTRERLEKETAEKDARLTGLERGGWVRAAAQDAKFIDPADALGRVDLSGIESEADAKKAVKKIAESAKHLVQSEDPTPPPAPGRVVQGGQPVDPNAPDPGDEENEKFLAELKEASSKGWSSTSAGVLDQ